MSDDWKEPSENPESGEAASGETSSQETEDTAPVENDEAAGDSAEEKKSDTSNTTYSWVNPKLRDGSDGKAKNIWGTSEDNDEEKNYRTYVGHSSAQQDGSAQSASEHTDRDSSEADHHTSRDSSRSAFSGSSDDGNGQYTDSGQTYSGTGRDQNGRKPYDGDPSVHGNTYENRQSSHRSSFSGANRAEERKARRARRKTERKKAGSGHPMTTGRKWGMTIAFAVVFGLVAGSVTYGVNRAESRLLGSGTTQSEDGGNSNNSIGEAVTSDSSGSSSDSSGSGSTGSAGTVAEVAKDAMPSLVTISTMSVEDMESFFGGTQQYEVEGAGTGVIVGENDSELLIATNNHVVEGANEVSVGFIDEEAVKASIKGTDSQNDLAVVAVKLSDIKSSTKSQIKAITLGDSDKLVLGEQVVAIGNALGYGQSVTSGYVSGLDRKLELSDGNSEFTSDGLIQTDAAINSGNSGGALLNMKGELVGINEAKSSSTSSGASVDNVGFSIPIAKAQPILEKLMNMETKEKVDKEDQGYLGIKCVDVTQQTSQMYDMPVGVCIREIAENGPMDEAGAKTGDVITEFDGTSISTYDDLTNQLQYYKAGDEVKIVVERSDNGSYKEKTLTVKLGSSDIMDSLSSDSGSGNSQDQDDNSQDSDSQNDSGRQGSLFPFGQ